MIVKQTNNNFTREQLEWIWTEYVHRAELEMSFFELEKMYGEYVDVAVLQGFEKYLIRELKGVEERIQKTGILMGDSSNLKELENTLIYLKRRGH